MMPRGFGLPVVITDNRSHNRAVAPFEAGNIAVHHQILAMLVMPAMADHVPYVVQKRASFQQHPRLCRQMMYGLQLVEEQNAQLADMLGMRLIVFQTPRKAARS